MEPHIASSSIMQGQASSHISPFKLHTNPIKQTNKLTMFNDPSEDVLLTHVCKGDIQVSHLFYLQATANNAYIIVILLFELESSFHRDVKMVLKLDFHAEMME